MGAPPRGQERLLPREPVARAARAAELRHLYEDERLPTTAIAARFGVTHKSVIGAMRRLGIARRPVGSSPHIICIEDGCDLPVHKVRHKTNGSWYGRRCYLHWVAFRMEVNQRYNDKHLGKDDEAWLRRMRQSVARARRISREVSQSLKPASAPATTSRSACPH